MELWTRKNIQNYTGDPDESSDINYSKKQQEIRRAIRAEDERTKKEGGGQVFAKDTEPQGKERTEDADLAVICEFPSMKDAVEAYESEEYRELSKLRKEATENSTFTIMEGLDEAAKLRRAMGL